MATSAQAGEKVGESSFFATTALCFVRNLDHAVCSRVSLRHVLDETTIHPRLLCPIGADEPDLV